MRFAFKGPRDGELDRDSRDLLERRAEQLRRPPPERETDEDVFWIAEFTLGDERHALPLEMVHAAIPLKWVTPVPLAPAHILGISRFHGRTLCVYSIASVLGV